MKDLQTFVSHSYPQVKLLFVFKSHSTIGGHFCFKDRQPQLCKSNLVYKYTCERCKMFYIGKTEQQLAARISEHKVSPFALEKSFKLHQNPMFMIILKNAMFMSALKILPLLTPSNQLRDF